LRKLVAGGLVRSFKGIQGGYELAKEPKEISLNDVIETVEGPFAISRCLCGEYICTRTNGQPCQFRNVYADISEEVVKRLSSYTFDKALPEQPEA